MFNIFSIQFLSTMYCWFLYQNIVWYQVKHSIKFYYIYTVKFIQKKLLREWTQVCLSNTIFHNPFHVVWYSLYCSPLFCYQLNSICAFFILLFEVDVRIFSNVTLVGSLLLSNVCTRWSFILCFQTCLVCWDLVKISNKWAVISLGKSFMTPEFKLSSWWL